MKFGMLWLRGAKVVAGAGWVLSPRGVVEVVLGRRTGLSSTILGDLTFVEQQSFVRDANGSPFIALNVLKKAVLLGGDRLSLK